MSLSLWDELQLEDKIFQILSVESHSPDHHFGRPFLTPYQIAIAFKALFPDDYARIGKPVGGKGAGSRILLLNILPTNCLGISVMVQSPILKADFCIADTW